eukprot:10580690-Karenia_brevis.AAC.1
MGPHPDVEELQEAPVHAPIRISFQIPYDPPKKTVPVRPADGLALHLQSVLRTIHDLDSQAELPKEVLKAAHATIRNHIHESFLDASGDLQSKI